MIEWIITGVLALLFVLFLFSIYRVVKPSEAHLVVTPKKKMVCSPDPKMQKNGGGNTYFAIPKIPFIGRVIRVMDVTIKELIGEMETYEKDQARYQVRFSIKYRIVDVEQASETFVDDEELQKQLDEIVRASVRAVTVKYDVKDARANKKRMSEEIETEIRDDLEQWGLKLINFVLVDFQDVMGENGNVISSIISDISKRREVEVNSETKQLNAQKIKDARIKEAEADEKSQEREIQRDEFVAKRIQDKNKAVAIQQALAKKEELEVTKIEQVKNAEIQKEKAMVVANQNKEVEAVNKEQQKLKGEGERLFLTEKAIGDAQKILQDGKAEAEAKQLLVEALNKFENQAITSLIAEKVVAKDRDVGIETAKALMSADVKVFSGGDTGKGGFDMGQVVEALKTSSSMTGDSILHRLKKPNDLGITLNSDDLLKALEGATSGKAKKVKVGIEASSVKKGEESKA